MNIGQQRVLKVLSRMDELVRRDEDYAHMFSESLEGMLEDMVGDDAFGSEGTTDPRGDGRNGQFSMWHVEGVDTE